MAFPLKGFCSVELLKTVGDTRILKSELMSNSDKDAST